MNSLQQEFDVVIAHGPKVISAPHGAPARHFEFFVRPLENLGSGPSFDSRRLMATAQAELAIIPTAGPRYLSAAEAARHISRVAVACSFLVGGGPQVGWEGPWFHLRYGEATALSGSVVLGEQTTVLAESLENLVLETYINGQLRSQARVAALMLPPADFISYVSTFLTPGARMLLLSGNPDGPVLDMDDARRPVMSHRTDLEVKPGDRVRTVIAGVGDVEVEVR